MPIQIECPKCREIHRFSDEVEGKKGKCKNKTCGTIFIIVRTDKILIAGGTGISPGTTGTSGTTETSGSPSAPNSSNGIPDHVHVEKKAEEILREHVPASLPKKNTKKIKVVCEYCEHSFEVDAAKGGKKIPCPNEECARIISVPKLEENNPSDWRTVQNRPLLARQDNVPSPEGTWGTNNKSYVAAESLIQAGAAPKIEYEPLPWDYKLQWIAAGVGVFLLLAIGSYFYFSSRSAQKREFILQNVIHDVEQNELTKNHPELLAGIYLQAATFRRQTMQSKAELDETLKYLNLARSKAIELKSHPELSAVLIDICKSQVHLGGDANQVKNQIRISWKEIQKDLRRTLKNIGDVQLRWDAVSQVSKELAKYHQAIMMVHICRQELFSATELPEAFGLIGLEMVGQDQIDEAKELLKEIGPMIDKPANTLQSPALTALRIALGSAEAPAIMKGIPVLQNEGNRLNEYYRVSFAQGYAYTGKWNEAVALALREGLPLGRVQAQIRVLRRAIEKDQLDVVSTLLDPLASHLVLAEQQGIPPWLQIIGAESIARAGKWDLAQAVVQKIKTEHLRNWAYYVIGKNYLVYKPEEVKNESIVRKLAKASELTLGDALMFSDVIRWSTRTSQKNIQQRVDSADPPVFRPFGLIGEAIGGQEPSR